MQDEGFTLNENLFYYVDKGGQHSEYYWGRRFSWPMLSLYGTVQSLGYAEHHSQQRKAQHKQHVPLTVSSDDVLSRAGC